MKFKSKRCRLKVTVFSEVQKEYKSQNIVRHTKHQQGLLTIVIMLIKEIKRCREKLTKTIGKDTHRGSENSSSDANAFLLFDSHCPDGYALRFSFSSLATLGHSKFAEQARWWFFFFFLTPNAVLTHTRLPKNCCALERWTGIGGTILCSNHGNQRLTIFFPKFVLVWCGVVIWKTKRLQERKENMNKWSDLQKSAQRSEGGGGGEWLEINWRTYRCQTCGRKWSIGRRRRACFLLVLHLLSDLRSCRWTKEQEKTRW